MSEPEAGATAEAAAGEHPTLGEWHPISDGIYRLVAEPESVNIGLVVGERSALLVDCGSSPQQGRRIREAVAEVTDLPLTAVVVTHGHYDHWFGLAAFSDLSTFGHEALAEDLESSETATRLDQMGLTSADLLLPKRQLSLVAAVDLGGRRVEIVHLGAGHSRSDVIAVVPEAQVIFAGDLVERPAPVLGEDAAPAQWAAALDALASLVRPETIVVPGHGDPMKPGDVMDQVGILHQLNYEVSRLVSSGVRLEDAAEQGEWPLPWEQISTSVRRIYAGLAAEGEVPRTRLPMADG